MKRYNGTSRAQRGFTLIELLIVGLIVTVALVFGIPFARGKLVEQKVPGVTRELQEAATKIRGTRMGDGPTPYGTISIAELGAMVRNARGFTPNANPATAITHAVGTGQGTAAVTVASDTLVAAGDSFTITMAEVDGAACSPLATAMQMQAEVITVTPVGGAAVTVKANGGQLNAATLQTTCDERNTMTFTFR